MITLREITRENYRRAFELEVKENQRGFVAPNAQSIAMSKFYPWVVIQGIYQYETMVGFVLYSGEAHEEIDHRYWIFRVMVDHMHQGRGYGRGGLEQVIARLQARPDCDAIYISAHPDNTAALRLYEKLGFVRTGHLHQGEIELCLTINK